MNNPYHDSSLGKYLHGLCCKKKIKLVNTFRQDVLPRPLLDDDGLITVEDLLELHDHNQYPALFALEVGIPIYNTEHIEIMLPPKER
jgi:hypothetical protein